MAYKKPRARNNGAKKVGPITQFENAKEYMESHHVPVLFQNLIASLMMERPEQHFRFLDAKLEAIKEIGIKNIDWDTFVYHLHPLRNPVRNQFIKDGPDKDPEEFAHFADVNEVRENPAEALIEVDEKYKADLFKLTEPDEDDDDDDDINVQSEQL